MVSLSDWYEPGTSFMYTRSPVYSGIGVLSCAAVWPVEPARSTSSVNSIRTRIWPLRSAIMIRTPPPDKFAVKDLRSAVSVRGRVRSASWQQLLCRTMISRIRLHDHQVRGDARSCTFAISPPVEGIRRVKLPGTAYLLPRQESFASLHILTRRASEGSEALPSLARRVRMSFLGARVITFAIPGTACLFFRVRWGVPG